MYWYRMPVCCSVLDWEYFRDLQRGQAVGQVKKSCRVPYSLFCGLKNLACNFKGSRLDCSEAYTLLQLLWLMAIQKVNYRIHWKSTARNELQRMSFFELHLFTPLRNSKSFCPSGMENTRITVPYEEKNQASFLNLNTCFVVLTLVSVHNDQSSITSSSYFAILVTIVAHQIRGTQHRTVTFILRIYFQMVGKAERR